MKRSTVYSQLLQLRRSLNFSGVASKVGRGKAPERPAKGAKMQVRDFRRMMRHGRCGYGGID